MSFLLSFRSQAVGGATIDPLTYINTGTAEKPAYKPISWKQFGDKCAGREVVFVVHGFNVSAQQGATSYFLVQPELPASMLTVGVLWPGDFWLPFINYPFEGGTAKDCGRRLAKLCDGHLGSATAVSFVTHSLGARLALEATAKMKRKVKTLCLMAGAVTNDCLSGEYASVKAKCDGIYILASRSDWVLERAFPVGDAIGVLLDPDHAPLRAALGFAGPRQKEAVAGPFQIADGDKYTHGHYLPPAPPEDGQVEKWRNAAKFASYALMGVPRAWPLP